MKRFGFGLQQRLTEVCVIGIVLLFIVSLIQMFALSTARFSDTPFVIQAEEERDSDSKKIPLRHTRKIASHTKTLKQEVPKMFQDVPDIVLPVGFEISLRGLQQLPKKFLSFSETEQEDFGFRLEPSRIIGPNGLLAIREFQGNSWIGTLMRGAIVFFVQSPITHYRRRILQRSTWASVRDIDGWKIEVIYVIEPTKDSVQQLHLVKESQRFGDILQCHRAEYMNKSTSRVLASIKWAIDRFPDDFYIASMTDDVFINVASVRDEIAKQANSRFPHQTVFNIRGSDGSMVTSSKPQKIYCFENYLESEEPQRNFNESRAIAFSTYDAPLWPPHCTEGLYILPVAFARELVDQWLLIDAVLPKEFQDVFVTGILRRKTNRGDDNIVSAFNADDRHNSFLRLTMLSRSTSTELAKFELAAENRAKSVWTEWYETIRYRFHILTDVASL